MKKTYIEPEMEYIDVVSLDFLSLSTDFNENTSGEITEDVKPIW